MLIPSGHRGGSEPSRPPSRNAAPRGAKTDAPRASTADLGDTFSLRIHHEEILPEDVTAIDGIPVTTPARTLLDLATVSGDRELECALAAALERGLTNRSEMMAVIARYPRHPGGPRLKALLEAWPRSQLP